MSYKMSFNDIVFIQTLLGVSADGYPGNKTFSKAEQLTRSRYKDMKAFIAFTQETINKHFKKAVKVDGIYGPNTESYIRRLRGASVPHRDSDVSTVHTSMSKGFKLTDDGRRKNKKYPTSAGRSRYYGAPGSNHVRMTFPYNMYYGDKRVKSTMVNKRCVSSFEQMFETVLDVYGKSEIARLNLDSYGGCFNNRSMRGGSRKSDHAYACAFDLDASHNRLHYGSNKAAFARSDYNRFMTIVYGSGLTC